MLNLKNLKQYFYCPVCDDFYEEHGIVLDFSSYLSSTMSDNLSNCPMNHQRSIDKESVVYLIDKPQKNIESTIVCLDIIKYSEKTKIAQFNNISIINASCFSTIDIDNSKFIYKNTGDGFIVTLKKYNVSTAIKFLEELILSFLSNTQFIKYRIGIDFGTFFTYKNFDDKIDFFGQPIIDATRIAEFGQNNNILLSERAANNLVIEDDLQKKNVLELGYCFDKHRKPHKVFNFRSENIGNEF